MIFNPVRHGVIKVFGERSNSGNGVKLIDAYFRWPPAAEESQNTRLLTLIPSLSGKLQRGTHMRITPWAYSQFYIYENGQFLSPLLSQSLKKAKTNEERKYWNQAGIQASQLTRHLII